MNSETISRTARSSADLRVDLAKETKQHNIWSLIGIITAVLCITMYFVAPYMAEDFYPEQEPVDITQHGRGFSHAEGRDTFAVINYRTITNEVKDTTSEEGL